jgi:hypothetical protein
MRSPHQLIERRVNGGERPLVDRADSSGEAAAVGGP